MTAAFVFPGQGSQSVGMGKALADASPAAAAVFAEVDEALGEKLSATMWDGPEDALTLTRNAQPALMAVSIAAVRAVGERFGPLDGLAAYLAGHSLGEYSALAAAGSLSLADTARLLRLRGDAMQRAVPAGAGGMAAVIGLDPAEVRAVAEAAAEGEVCAVANDNGGGQLVLSGSAAAIARAIDLAKARGAKRVVPLPVSAPFHCRLMAPAAEEMAEALSKVSIAAPSVPVVANVTARPYADVVEIRSRLVEQVTGMVRWRESVDWMAAAGVDRFVEVGSGKVLAGLIRRIAANVETVSVGAPGDLDGLAERLKGVGNA
ncbi:MAG: ACP S-malonyltransferase [Bauldia sp.]|nr:ACP S-malonyltransferase [Bauldia sp.]